jgi:hypothetical protein
MNTPDNYNSKLADIYHHLRWDLIDLLNEHFNGCYVRQDKDPYIKLSNIIGTPIVYEVRAGGSGNIFYKSGLWTGTNIIRTNSEGSYELTDAHLFTVYKALYKLVYSEGNY